MSILNYRTAFIAPALILLTYFNCCLNGSKSVRNVSHTVKVKDTITLYDSTQDDVLLKRTDTLAVLKRIGLEIDSLNSKVQRLDSNNVKSIFSVYEAIQDYVLDAHIVLLLNNKKSKILAINLLEEIRKKQKYLFPKLRKYLGSSGALKGYSKYYHGKFSSDETNIYCTVNKFDKYFYNFSSIEIAYVYRYKNLIVHCLTGNKRTYEIDLKSLSDSILYVRQVIGQE
jgi:hypothetical protein